MKKDIVFHCTLTRVTNDDGEQVSIAFNAANSTELNRNLETATTALNVQRDFHNAKVLVASEELRKKVEAAREKIAREERQRLADAGHIPHDLVNPKEANGADATTGAPDLRADS